MATRFIVPARKGSKGFPKKNRILVPHLLRTLSRPNRDFVVATDDDVILTSVDTRTVKLPSQLTKDEASVKPSVKYVGNRAGFNERDDVFLLYPTYPGRTIEDMRNFYRWYKKNGLNTACCQVQATKETPTYLALRQGGFPVAKRPVPHRRQDAKGTLKDFGEDPSEYGELCHYMCCFQFGEIDRLSKNFFSEDTRYYELQERKINVDYKEDWQKYLETFE